MPKQISSYLSSLKFDPKLWNTIQARYLVNIRLVILLILGIVIVGLSNVLSIPRRLNPEVKIPIVTVITSLSGASPQDIEQLVTVPLEDKLSGVKGLDTMTSSSSEGVSVIILQFLSTVDSEKARTDTQSIVDTVTGLPSDAKTPTVKAIDFEDQPIWDFIVTTKSDYPSLMRFSKTLKNEIEDVAKVDRVSTSGYDEREIQIVIDPIKLKEFSLSPLQFTQAITRATQAYPAGNITTNGSTVSLSINQEVVTVEDIRNLHLNVQGQVIRLSDVAAVSERSKLNQPKTYFVTKNSVARPGVEFFVYKTSSANIDAAEKDVRVVVDRVVKDYGNRFQVTTVTNSADEIVKQFSDLLGEFGSTIILVFINLLLFLGLRQAFISSLTIPLTFLSAISVIHIMGLTLNFLTLFAFLIALGLLIDDTIVTVAAMTRYYSTGKFTAQETGLLVWKDFIVPLWSTTITTIWAFVPLLLASGIIGEFIKPIPIVVTATMLSSTTIAVLITLPLMMIILKPSLPARVRILLRVIGFIVAALFIYFLLPKSALLPVVIVVLAALIYVAYRERRVLDTWAFSRMRVRRSTAYVSGFMPKLKKIIDHGLINTEVLSYRYMKIIDRILGSRSARRNTILALVVFAVVAYLLVPLGFVVNEFFPKTDQDIIYINVELPTGTTVQSSTVEMLALLPEIKNTDGLNFAVAATNASFSNTGDRMNTTNTVLYTLHLVPKEDRKLTSTETVEVLRDRFKSYTRGKLTVQELSGGPPAGADIQIKLLGENLTLLDSYANTVMDFLKKQPGVTNVDKSIKPGTSRLVFVPDKVKLAEAGLTQDMIAVWFRTYASGLIMDSLKIEDTTTDIIMRLNMNTMTPEELGSIVIPTTNGNSVPLLSLGTFRLETNPTIITREDGKRSISVSGSVIKGYSIPQKNADLEKYAKTIHLASGYSWQTGGVNEENQKSIQSIFQAMIYSLLLILVTLVIEFRSFRQALIVMLVIPLAIPGVFYIFALTGTPLSFPALIGVLALFGIVVTNAIVVVEKINDNRREGMPLREAIVDASGSRLEPILLTSITSILGLIPITLSDPLWRGLGGAIISGLLFSGLIKLFFVPVMYYNWYKEKDIEKE